MASLCDVNHRAQAFYFLRRRDIIACELGAACEAVSDGEIAVDESAWLAASKEDTTAMLGTKSLYLAYAWLAVVCWRVVRR